MNKAIGILVHSRPEGLGIWLTNDLLDYNCSLCLFCYNILVAVVATNAMVVSVAKESGYGCVKRCFIASKEKS